MAANSWPLISLCNSASALRTPAIQLPKRAAAVDLPMPYRYGQSDEPAQAAPGCLRATRHAVFMLR